MPKQQRSTQAMIVVIGGFLQPRTGPKNPRLQGVEKIDPRSNSWSSLADFPMKSSGAVALNLRGHLFCLAYEPVENRRGATLVTETRIFEFDLVKNQWLDARSNFSDQVLTCIDECLQASGAVTVCEETSVIYTVSGTEVCRIPFTELDGNIFCKQVHYLPKPAEYMSPSHCMHSAIVVNQNLYVLGGGDKAQRSDTVPSNIVIMFDPSEGVWTRKNGMIEQRLKMDVATINGQIYASGGFNIHRLNTVECYNPQTDMWLRVQHMNWGRSHHKMLALNGRLWAIGGKSYSSGNQAPRDVLNSCEVYDPDQNKWTEGPSMRHARCNFAATVL
ncbi:influenza virus NS1A-binding protein homolog [Pomacea canaliculata]|nr:influenza virus NS1A-binding protein homolog [Pomacea canaliculata]